MKYFAKINENNVVENVVVAENIEWCQNNLGGVWVETFIDVEGKNYAGIGHIYNKDKDNFHSERPYESWFLNEDCVWEAPLKKPEPTVENGEVVWNENITGWEEKVRNMETGLLEEIK